MNLFSPRRLASLVGVLAILVGLYLTGMFIYQKVTWNRTLSPVQDAISVASVEGFSYPNARTVSPKMESRYRAAEFAAGLEHSLSELRIRFENDPSHDPGLAFWLGAGYTVSGNLETARGVIDIGRVHNPFDERLWNLEAILIVKEGDRALARERLETLIEMFPENALAVQNLRALDTSNK